MSSPSLSIRSKLLLGSMAGILVFLFLILLYLDAQQHLRDQVASNQHQARIHQEVQVLQHEFFTLTQARRDEHLGACLQSLDRLDALLQFRATSTDAILSAVYRLSNDLRAEALDPESQWTASKAGMHLLMAQLAELDVKWTEGQERKAGNYQKLLSSILGVIVLLMSTLFVLFTRDLLRSLGKLQGLARALKGGTLPPHTSLGQSSEFQAIGADLEAHVKGLSAKKDYLQALAQSASVESFPASREDELGNAIIALSKTISDKELEVLDRNRDDKKQNWISEGVAQVGEVLRSQRENVDDLAFALVQKLVNYMHVEMGSMYIAGRDEQEGPFLELKASYAYDRRKYQSSRLAWGENLPGTCAQEKKRIFLTDVPESYFEISSGTSSAKPNCLLLVPLIVDEQVNGIIELATVRLLRPYEISFVESLADSIASSLHSVQINQQNAVQLEQAKREVRNLQEREVEHQAKLDQLQQDLQRSQNEEAAAVQVLEAVQSVYLMAELSPTGRFTSMNDTLLGKLELGREQVLGKLYSEYAQVDPYSDEHKTFWSDLKKGKPRSATEFYHLFSGKALLLEQHFVPLTDAQGKVSRILNLATDVTEKQELQTALQQSQLELTRGSLDMTTLMKAVSSSLIKCDLDAEGIIMEVNEKFTAMSGYSRKELLGRNYRLFLKEAEKQQFEKIWTEVTKNKVYEGVIRRSRPTGEETWLASTFSPVVNEDHEVYKVYLMGLDITEKRLKYQLLEEANLEIDRLREKLRNLQ